MLITGLEGPITIASAVAIASRTSGVGSAASIPPSSTASTAGSPRSTIRYSCSARQPAAVRTRVRTAVSLIGSTRRSGTGAAGDLRLGVGDPASLADEVGPVKAGGEVAVGEPEPVRRPELDQPLEGGEAVVADPPAALLVDLARQPVGDQVRVGGDVDAEGLDVVAGVGDHRQVACRAAPASRRPAWRRRCLPPAARPSRHRIALSAMLRPLRAHAQWSWSGSPVIRIPAWVL